MLELRDQHGETVNLGHLEFDKVTYVEVVPSEYALRLHERPGATVCLHASALGKAILAFSDEEFASNLIRGRELAMLTRNTITDPREFMAELKRVRERGYAFDRGETSLLASCVAAPIVNGAGSAIAAISISGPSSRFNPRKDSGVIEALLHATTAISRQLRAHPEPAAKVVRRVARAR
jgi:IclR family acetate operon transcriptional repressor